MKFHMKFTGFREFDQLLKQLPKQVQKKTAVKATRNALRMALPAAKAAAPKDLQGRSKASRMYGRLQSNLRVFSLRRMRAGQAGARLYTRHAFWGHILELGSKFHRARPWLKPVIARYSQTIMRKLRDELTAGIAEEIKKLTGRK